MGTLPSLIPLRGCNVIVTGAVGGVGSVLMSALEELDCRVAGIDLPAAVASGADPDRLIGADLADADSAYAAVHAAVGRLGGLDCLVGAAASVATLHRADRFPAQAFRDDVAANLHSQFWTAQAAYPALVASKVGLTPDGGHLTGGTAGPAGRLSVCRASVGSTPRR